MATHFFPLIFLVLLLISICSSLDGRGEGGKEVEEEEEEYRLIQFNETYSVWMSLSEVKQLAECSAAREIHFMDITDYPRLGEYHVPNPTTIPSGPTHQKQVDPLLQQLSETELKSNIEYLSTQFTTRYYTSTSGVAAVEYLASTYLKYAEGRDDVEVVLFSHTWPQPSLIVRINGNGDSANEIVIVGGHVDSTSSGAKAPGADDDASGSATVLEIFRVIASSGFKPSRTLEFHGYAAEEVGLRGSQAIAQSYVDQGKVVVAMLQLDMTGYVSPGTTPTLGVMTDYTNANINVFLRKLALAYTSTKPSDTSCGYACSDNASWYKAGYPASYVFETLDEDYNPYIHTVNDLLKYLTMDHAMEYARLGVGFMVELSYDE